VQRRKKSRSAQINAIPDLPSFLRVSQLTLSVGEVYQICSKVVRPLRRPRVVEAVRIAVEELLGTERRSSDDEDI